MPALYKISSRYFNHTHKSIDQREEQVNANFSLFFRCCSEKFAFLLSRGNRITLPQELMSIFQDWLFSKEFLEDSSSPRFVKCSPRDEILYRKKTIMFIEDLGVEMKWSPTSFLISLHFSHLYLS